MSTSTSTPEASTAPVALIDPNEAAVPAEAPSAVTPPARSGKVIEAVAVHIEPVTRFGRDDLREAQPEVETSTPVTVELVQAAKFQVAQQGHKGPLAEGVDAAADTDEMNRELGARLTLAVNEAPQALQRWADDNERTYRRLMPAGAAFFRRSNPVGCAFACPSCEGHCKVTCTGCKGHGEVYCSSCSGHGQYRCSQCGGTTRVRCSGCGGRGQMAYSGVRNGVSVTEYHNCGTCGGAGSLLCWGCYLGWVNCNTCSATGKLTCRPCHGSGQVNCDNCDATGWRNLTGQVVCAIEMDETTAAATEDNRASALLAALDRDALRQLGTLTEVKHTVVDLTLRTVHSLQVPVQRAQIHSAGEVFELHGFGPHAKVFDYRNIAGHLLDADLQALTAATAATRGLRRGQASELLPALSQFLRSELNMLIAEAASGPRGEAAVRQAVQQKFHGMVSGDYVDAAKSALHAALGKVYGAEVAEPALYLSGLALLAGAGLQWFQWPHSQWLISAALAAAAAGLAWGATEFVTMRRIARLFEAPMGQRVLAQTRAEGSVVSWRTRALAAMVVAAGLGAFLPWKWVHSTAASQQALAQASTPAARAWEAWQQQGPDVARRRLADGARLENWAREGDDKARLMLAWAYTLGADGRSKDLRQAQQQLVGPLGKTRDGKVIQAVILLNQDATPAQIMQAATDLDMAAQAGMVEARYWRARIAIAQQGPLYNPRQGMEAMRQAAEQGHGHAAFVLGRIYAEGRHEQPKDIQKARKYLTQAQTAGVAEAVPLLARL